MAKAEYKEKTMAFFQAVKSLGVDKIFLIQIGNHREFPDRYVPMQEAQEEIAEEMEDVIMTSRLFRTFRDRGLMKDSFHYKQEAYNLVGEEAGARTGEILTKEAGKIEIIIEQVLLMLIGQSPFPWRLAIRFFKGPGKMQLAGITHTCTDFP